jgi:hypothetical protein
MLALWKIRASDGRESSGGTADNNKPGRLLPVAAAQKSVPVLRQSALRLPVKSEARPRLVFAVDATASRSEAWEAAQKLTARLFAAVPGELDVALAVHGGGRVHTFTPFLSDPAPLRALAAKIRCKAGETRLLDILARVLRTEDVGVVVYIGDVFEESETKALRLADALKRHGTRVIILHDSCSRDFDDGEMFRAIAERTDGAVLPFNISALEQLGQLLEAVAVLAVGGVEMVEANAATMPAAPLLLEHLGASKRRALR